MVIEKALHCGGPGLFRDHISPAPVSNLSDSSISQTRKRYLVSFHSLLVHCRLHTRQLTQRGRIGRLVCRRARARRRHRRVVAVDHHSDRARRQVESSPEIQPVADRARYLPARAIVRLSRVCVCVRLRVPAGHGFVLTS
jgi:hypothetical protein